MVSMRCAFFVVLMQCYTHAWTLPTKLATRRDRASLLTRAGVDDNAESGIKRSLPLDFGSRGAEWQFEWLPYSEKEASDEWDVRDLVTGAVVFLTCHLNALVLLGGTNTASRVLGIGAFVFAQANAANAVIPLRYGLSLSDFRARFQWAQSIEVSQIGQIAWPLVAVGASVPVLQAVLVPLALSGSLDSLHLPGFIFDPQIQLVVPVCEEVVFRLWLLDAARLARLPYTPSIILTGLTFGLWHGWQPTSIALGLLGSYWGHLYAQTGNVLVPITMHAIWNTFALYAGTAL